MPRILPTRPNLEYLRHQAKDLLKAYYAGDSAARQLFAQHLSSTMLHSSANRAPRRVVLASWERRESIRERLDLLAARTTSDTWQLPDSILQESIRQVEAWARETYGDLEQPRPLQANFTMLFYVKRDA